MAKHSGEGEESESGRARTAPSSWEHAAGAIGAVITIATLAFMIYEAVTAPADPVPQLVVRVDTIVAYRSGYVAEFRAINDGDATAAHVQILGELRADTGVVERSESSVDFVPARSWREGGLVFQNDPRRYRLEVRPVGFDRP
jgi:uncharacterized protein (TIGR02588 family)